jgi:hypothetical protein
MFETYIREFTFGPLVMNTHYIKYKHRYDYVLTYWYQIEPFLVSHNIDTDTISMIFFRLQGHSSENIAEVFGLARETVVRMCNRAIYTIYIQKSKKRINFVQFLSFLATKIDPSHESDEKNDHCIIRKLRQACLEENYEFVNEFLSQNLANLVTDASINGTTFQRLYGVIISHLDPKNHQ